jgi:hypothetical protein
VAEGWEVAEGRATVTLLVYADCFPRRARFWAYIEFFGGKNRNIAFGRAQIRESRMSRNQLGRDDKEIGGRPGAYHAICLQSIKMSFYNTSYFG